MRRGQQGLTLIGFVVVLIVLGCFAYLGMKLIPMYNEYFAIKKALSATVLDPEIPTASEAKIRDRISRHFEIGYVYSIEPKDIKIKRDEHGVSLSVDYEARTNFISNIDLVGHFVDTETTPGSKPSP